ncbi:iron hydrogenase [Morchella snyderi]|nr:iron hydrogenase [Morchella snyderi]
MSAILSADDLNDFISPGVACIKPVETLPAAPPKDNPYEVVLEDKAPQTLTPAQISLTDCLACSGCVTSAEAVLVSLQSHNEVLANLVAPTSKDKKFIALVSPQTRASLAVTYGVTEKQAGWMIEQLLCGSEGIRTATLESEENGQSKIRGFDLVLDTNITEEIALHYAAEELLASLSQPAGEGISKKKPILTSACPGFVCYLESTQPALIPHLSTLKSPQAILGTAVKTLLQSDSGPSGVYVVGIMPCFDKKLEGARAELTSSAWGPTTDEAPVRDVDCVITTRELISLAQSLNLDFSTLPRKPLSQPPADAVLSLLSRPGRIPLTDHIAGTSGGYLTHIVARLIEQTPGAQLRVEKGRNVDTVDYVVFRPGSADGEAEEVIARLARCYGFRNIQNLVRRLKPAKTRVLPRFGKAQAAIAARKAKTAAGAAAGAVGSEYAYVEVMACPGGCTNGGGQVKFNDEIALPLASESTQNQKEWVARVDEAYYSAGEEEGRREGVRGVRGVRGDAVETFVKAWESRTGIEKEKLLFTGYRQVENDLGKTQEVDVVARAAELAMKAGGGW